MEYSQFAQNILRLPYEPPFFVFGNQMGVPIETETIDDDPFASLAGRCASPECHFIAVYAEAVVRDSDRDTFVLFIMDREGSSHISLSDEPTQHILDAQHHSASGRIPDACRRFFRLPTAPPQQPTEMWFMAIWLHVIASASIQNNYLDWPTICAFHPCCPSPNATPAQLSHSIKQLAASTTWDELRQNFDTPLSLWMDDGMFSRWAMAEFPDIEQLLEIIEAQVPARVFDLVLATVQLSGLAPFDSVDA